MRMRSLLVLASLAVFAVTLAGAAAPIVGTFRMSGVDHWVRDQDSGESQVEEDWEFSEDHRLVIDWKTGRWSRHGSGYRANLKKVFREHVEGWYPTLETKVLAAKARKIRLEGDALSAQSKFAYSIVVDGVRKTYSDASILNGVRQ